MKLNPYALWRERRANQEARAKENYRLTYSRGGFFMQRMPVSFFRIASLPTIRKEDLMYLRINYVNGNLTTSVEKKTP